MSKSLKVNVEIFGGTDKVQQEVLHKLLPSLYFRFLNKRVAINMDETKSSYKESYLINNTVYVIYITCYLPINEVEIFIVNYNDKKRFEAIELYRDMYSAFSREDGLGLKIGGIKDEV